MKKTDEDIIDNGEGDDGFDRDHGYDQTMKTNKTNKNKDESCREEEKQDLKGGRDKKRHIEPGAEIQRQRRVTQRNIESNGEAQEERQSEKGTRQRETKSLRELQ